MSVILIDASVIEAINAAVARARANPLRWDEVMQAALPGEQRGAIALADRPPDFTRPSRSEWVSLGDFRCAISFEQQPTGLVRHLSVSLHGGSCTPAPTEITALALAFGFSGFPPDEGRFWLEEFSIGRWAVNVIELARMDA